MLDENVVIVPVANFCSDFKPREDTDEFTETNIASAEKNLSILALDNIVKTRPDVEIDSREINLSKVSGVIHVSQNHVNIFRRANS